MNAQACAAINDAMKEGSAGSRGMSSGNQEEAVQGRQPVSRSVATGSRLTGTFQEQVDVAHYSYLRLSTATGDVWVAVPLTHLDDQARLEPVSITAGVPVRNVEFGSTGRRLDLVYFGTLEHDGAARPQ